MSSQYPMGPPGPASDIGSGAAPGTPGWLPVGPDPAELFPAAAGWGGGSDAASGSAESRAETYGFPAGPSVPAAEGPAVPALVQARRWLIAAIVLALVGGFAAGQVYYLKAHTVTRYEQTAPGATVTVGKATYELLSLETTPTLPGYGDEPDKPQPGEAFLVATLHVTPHTPKPSSALCYLNLLAEPGHSWEPESESTVAPPEDDDFCELLADGTESTVYLSWKIPAAEVPAVTGVVVEPYDGSPYVVLRPPA